MSKVALAQEAQPIPPVRDVHVSDIFISSELGYVVERYQPESDPNPPVIVHIQEAHTNYEGQKHLVSILEGLVNRYGLKLIMVEGGEGDVSLAYLREYGPPENRKEVAEKYLKAGILSGEEYLEIVSDYPLTIWGVEHKYLYDENLQMFLDVQGLGDRLRPIMANVDKATDVLAPRLLPPALKELESNIEAFKRDEIGLGEYTEFLALLTGSDEASKGSHPNFYQFLEVRRLEKEVDLSQVPVEQQAVITEMSTQIEPASLKRLVAQALEMKAGKVTRAQFYTSLEEAAAEALVDLTRYPNLSRYIHYVQQSALIKPAKLADEMDDIAADLKVRLATTPGSRELMIVMDQVDLVEKLLDLRLSPEEYQRFLALDRKTIFSNWKQFLSRELSRLGLPDRSFGELEGLTPHLFKLQRFYDIAHKRDVELVKRAMSKLEETEEPIGVLISGGFHSPKITELLKERGVGVVVLAPKVSQATNERLYHAVLRYKSGQGSFEEVMRIANETGPVAASD